MRTEVRRHRSGLGEWEMVSRAPHPALDGQVLRYCGYVERTPQPLRRREVATTVVPLILSFGPEIDLLRQGVRRRSFVAGLDDAPATTEHAGEQHGLQVDLDPLAAGRLLGVPMHELAGQVIELEDVLGRDADLLVERLAGLPGWEARFALLDALLARRLAEARPPHPAMAAAWLRMRDARGGVGVAALARDTGWSRRQLVTRFRDHVGVPPRTARRLLRFQRAVDLLARDDGARLAAIAQDCGFYDQAHLNREFRALGGGTPTDFVGRLLPDGGGVAG
jgi:AraC-like DNA-binding protein